MEEIEALQREKREVEEKLKQAEEENNELTQKADALQGENGRNYRRHVY
jgi:chromosome segregation ATPase